MKEVRYHPAARGELFAASDWYEDRAALGNDFLTKAAAAESAMSKHEDSFPWVEGYEPLRGARLDRYPYRLIYAIQETVLFVLAVAHDGRAPGYWSDRLTEA